MSWIQTLDGKKFDLWKPSPDAVEPNTLAVVLSRICRFGGHCRNFYSVAQHSVLVCDLVSSPELKLPALLHDAHEAYWGYGDVCRPAKRANGLIAAFFRSHQLAVDCCIADRFGIDPMLFDHPEIKHADNVALATEARDLMEEPPVPWEKLPNPSPVVLIEPVGVDEAYRRFATRLYELWSDQ